MLKCLPLLIFVVLLYGPCGGKKRPPIVNPPQPTPIATPQPTAEPISTPTPSPSPIPSPDPTPVPTPAIPLAWATPFPTPNVDPASYIPAPKQGSTVRLQGEEGEDYAAKIQGVMDNSANIAQVVLGPGSLKRSVILRTHTKIETTPKAPIACDQAEGIVGDIKPGEQPWNQLIPHSDYGCFLVADGVHVSGNFEPPQELLDYFAKGNPHLGWHDPYFLKLAALTDDQIAGNYSTVLEPEFSLGPQNPGIIVFQALGDATGSHQGTSKNLAITGIVIQGRQKTHYDGGVRAAIPLGNCKHCTVQNTFLRDTGSIGLQTGGVAMGQGNYSDDNLLMHNIASGVAAANIAAVNSENFNIKENYARRPGRKGWGGGISAVDMETNSPADHSSGWITNNLADYEDSAIPFGAGSAFLAQDPYTGANRGKVVIANNVAIGGRDDILYRHMSNGLYIVGLKGCEIINNYVYRTGQNALQAYNSVGCLIQDNDFHHTGGGGAPTVQFYGIRDTVVRRSNFRSANVPINVQPGFGEVDGSCGNRFEDNLIDGRAAVQSSPECKEQAPVKNPKPPKFVSGSSWRGPRKLSP